jgi:hypothetical protein
MPPKAKKGNEVSAKTEKKQQAKVVEDLTFGLKNKNKSKVVQNYVKSVTHQVFNGNNQKGGANFLEQQKYAEQKEKKKKAEADALLASLFKNAQNLKNVQEEVTSNA